MRGFTLLELIVAVAIIGILVAVAVPQYRGYVDNARITNAQNNLRAIYLKEQEYYSNNNAYYSTGATCGDNASTINTNLFSGQNIINDAYFTYCVTQTSTDDFTAQATKTSSGTVYTLDYNNVDNF